MIPSARWLASPLGDHLVLARPGPQRGQKLLVLDPLAGWIWQSRHAGLSVTEIAELLAARFDLSPDQAHADVMALLEAWRREGETVTPNPEALQPTVEGTHPPAPPLLTAPTWILQLADRRAALMVDDPALAAPLERITRHLWDNETATPPAARLHLAGTAADWRLCVDDVALAVGDAPDEAVARTVAELVEAACATDQRLLVLHAAGVSRAGRGVLLIGPGGAGKTTLATALNASGWELLSDDVIPVTLEGHLLGLGMSLCLKAGGWPVLAPWLPDLDRAPLIERAGRPVRFPPPPGPIVRGPLPTAAFLFPRYQPDQAAALEALDPVRVLRGLIEAQSVIAELTQDKLLALTRWISSAPGFALSYPDLDHALAMIVGLPLEMSPTSR